MTPPSPQARLRQLAADASRHPWDSRNPYFPRVVYDARGYVVASAEKVERGPANASLIALAPEMAVLLADMADYIDRLKHGDWELAEADLLLTRLARITGDTADGASA